MSAYNKKVQLSDLTDGMFVSELPIPWRDTPFPMQGFYIRSQEDIDELAKFCEEVFIDTVRSTNKTVTKAPTSKRKRTSAEPDLPVTKKTIHVKPIKIRSERYANTLPSSFAKELKKIKRVHAKILKSVKSISEKLGRGDESAVIALRKTSGALVESAISNPDAAIWLTQMESQRNDLFQHSVNATIWAIVFGRHLGLEPEVLEDITLALLLSKIGLLQDPDSEEVEVLPKNSHPHSYIERSIALIEKCHQVRQRVISAVRTHLERHDGSGSPLGMMGSQIPMVGKVAGIADYYEALINPINKDQRALCSHEASQLLFSLRDTKFQGDLVEEFIKAIGIYPTGSVVELNSKEMAIIIESKPNARLHPKILLITDSDKKQLPKPKVIDLTEQKHQQTIKKSLPNTAVDISVSNFNFGGWMRFSA